MAILAEHFLFHRMQLSMTQKKSLDFSRLSVMPQTGIEPVRSLTLAGF